MCGIAGFFNIRGDNGSIETQELLMRMIAPLKHRGPDGYGFYVGQRAGLAHARLSIIDLEGGWQPIANEDESLWIVFNGEIFNYPELRSELLKKGHRFSTESDTEVILHLYEDKGKDCLHYLNGQFALAIYDCRNHELFVARDRMGIRPFFYIEHHGVFYFASEIKSLFNGVRNFSPQFNYHAITDIFTFWSPVAGDTTFGSVKQLPPGYCMSIGRDGVHDREQYWDIPFSQDRSIMEDQESCFERLHELLVDAVKIRLRADVPVGAYLSGGLDSSTITSIIRNYTNNPLKTFSVAFLDEVYDERNEQRTVASYLKTDHHMVDCSYGNIADIFPDVLWHTETPILRTAPAPLYILSNLVNENNYKVVLTGEGADEIFGGYDIFKEAKIRAFIYRLGNSKLRPLLLKRLYPYLALSPTQSAEYARKFFDTDLDPFGLFYAHQPRWKTTSKTHVFLQKDVLEHTGTAEDRLWGYISPMADMDGFTKAQYLESKLLLGNYLLSSQGDRMGMAHSVEGRYPFLDHRVVEFAGTIPVNLKMKVLNEKYALKKAFADILPGEIVNRKKQPYMAPDILSFFGDKEPEYIGHYLSDQMVKEAGVFKPEPVKRLMKKCRKKGRQGFMENMAFVGILSTQIIYDKFIRNFHIDTSEQFENVRVRAENSS